MKQSRSSESGVAHLLAVGLVVVVAAVGFAGWKVYDANQAKTTDGTATSDSAAKSTDTKTTAAAETPAADETAGWKKVDSIGGAFSIKVPDGWKLTNYPGNTLNGDGLTYAASTPAVIAVEANAYAGDQKNFNVVVSDTQESAPQWQSPNQYGKETTADYTAGSQKGKKYSIEYTEDVTGIAKGDKVYQYVFNLSSGKQMSVVYKQYAGSADNLALVEKTISTIVIN